MKCERIRELVSDALDGVLPHGVADRFHDHLDACPPCRTYHAELKESLLLLEELPTVEVTEEFDRAVWARIRQEEPFSLAAAVRENLEMLRVRFSAGMGFLRWSPAFAVALVLLGIAATSPPHLESARESAAVATVSGSETLEALSAAENGASEPRDQSRPETRKDETYSEFAEFASGMPRAVEEFVATGRELRLMSSGTYEMSNYSYPLRQIPDPVRRAFPPSARTSLRRAGGPQSTPVGVVRPVGRPGTDAGVAVFEF